MCVICYKPSGVEMPDQTRIKAMAAANPHGFGFVSSTGQYYRTTDFAAFAKRVAALSTDEAVIMHFRFATHGSIKASNCHPFRSGNVYFAHNGVLPFASINDKTDSEFAFRRFLMPQIRAFGLQSVELGDEVARIIGGSRFAFMQGNCVRLFGEWANLDGCKYSNLRWAWHRANNFGKCLYL